MQLLLLLLVSSSALAANSFPVLGANADALVNAYVRLGSDPVGTHEYFQAGVSACAKRFDEVGGYFPGGRVGDYVGESCLIYGSNADGSDEDGTLRLDLRIPADDRDLSRHPELAAKLALLRGLRESLEALVIPIVAKNADGVVTSELIGISGVACEGRTQSGARLCYVKPSERCPQKP